MKVRSRAPLRLGFGGGGTDVSPYSDMYGGVVLNASINLYAHCSLTDECSEIRFSALDMDVEVRCHPSRQVLSGDLILHKAVYNWVMENFNAGVFIPVELSTRIDAPVGSGLGSSSTLVVSMLKAFQELMNLPLGEYDLAKAAFQIERHDCNLAGGKQDQYSAAFGGFNYMEFQSEESVIVNPLRIKQNVISELEERILLFYTGTGRESARIIDDQKLAVHDTVALSAMHEVKSRALQMKESILRGDVLAFVKLQSLAWEAKKKTSKLISNSNIEEICQTSFESGAHALKISGAGGGGFMLIYCDPDRKLFLQKSLNKFNNEKYSFNFTDLGAESWIYNTNT